MSRHIIEAKNPAQHAVVGWDRPLHNFFGTVFDNATEEVVEWIFGEATLDALVAKLQPFAVIPDSLQKTLTAESREANHPMTKVVDHRRKTA